MEKAEKLRDEIKELEEQERGMNDICRALKEMVPQKLKDDLRHTLNRVSPKWRLDDARRQLAVLEKGPFADMPKESSISIGLPTQRSSSAEQERFPNRAQWLQARLDERGWDKHRLCREGESLEHRTVQKVLDGKYVYQTSLNKIANALSNSTKHPRINLRDIPAN